MNVLVIGFVVFGVELFLELFACTHPCMRVDEGVILHRLDEARFIHDDIIRILTKSFNDHCLHHRSVIGKFHQSFDELNVGFSLFGSVAHNENEYVSLNENCNIIFEILQK